jgi:hypothetical protein
VRIRVGEKFAIFEGANNHRDAENIKVEETKKGVTTGGNICSTQGERAHGEVIQMPLLLGKLEV